MTKEDKKLLAVHLDKYIKQKHTLEECCGFSDGFQLALQLAKNNESLNNVSGMFPALNTVRQEIDKYNEKTIQGDKGHFQNGINWAFNHISKQVKNMGSSNKSKKGLHEFDRFVREKYPNDYYLVSTLMDFFAEKDDC